MAKGQVRAVRGWKVTKRTSRIGGFLLKTGQGDQISRVSRYQGWKGSCYKWTGQAEDRAPRMRPQWKEGLEGACLKSGQGESFCQSFLLFKERSSILFLSKQFKFIFHSVTIYSLKTSWTISWDLVMVATWLYCETQRHLVREIPMKMNRKTEIRGWISGYVQLHRPFGIHQKSQNLPPFLVVSAWWE